MLSIRKRGAVYGVIGLMLCVAVYLNWNYFQTPETLTVADQAAAETAAYGEITAVDSTSGENTTTDSDKNSDDFFAKTRLSRQTARDEALTMLKETVSDESASEDAKKDASAQITKIAGDMVKEERAESRIKAKGYADAVVTIAEDAVSIVVAPPENGLTAADAATISEIATEETGADPSILRITEAS